MSRESFTTGDFKFIFFVFAFASRLLLVPLPFYYALQVCQVKKKIPWCTHHPYIIWQGNKCNDSKLKNL